MRWGSYLADRKEGVKNSEKKKKKRKNNNNTQTDKRGQEGREARSRQDNVGQQRIISTALSPVKSMAVRAPGESGAELCYLWPLNAASSATIRFLPPPHVTEGTPPFSFYLCCSGALWEMWFCVHLRCPRVTHHCSPSRVFFFFCLYSLFQNGDDGLILFCIISKILGQIKFYFIANTFTPMENLERKLQRPHRCTHTGKTCKLHSERPWSQELHPRPSVKPSVFFHCLSYPLGHVFTNFSSDTDYLFYIFFSFLPWPDCRKLSY